MTLDTGADERAVRKSYARELKQIDQQADPAGFQSLRQAYEAALQWVRSDPSAGREDAHRPDPGAAMASDRPAVRSDAAVADRTPSADEATAPTSPQETSAEEAEIAPMAQAAAVFQVFLGRLSPTQDREQVLAALAESLGDPRLVNLDAHTRFEWHVAHHLARGWRPGNEVLLVAAIAQFDWAKDRHRLDAFGPAGAVIEASITERAMFDSQAPGERERQRQLIRALRDDAHPGERVLVTQMGQVEWMASAFPHWMRLITRVDRIAVWRDWNQSIPNDARLSIEALATKPPAARPGPRNDAGPLKYIGWTLPLVLVLSFFQQPKPTPPALPRFPPVPLGSPAAVPRQAPAEPPKPTGRWRGPDDTYWPDRDRQPLRALPPSTTEQPGAASAPKRSAASARPRTGVASSPPVPVPSFPAKAPD